MKKELDPFESKLKEKLQGKAYFPEDILWKRLNDELVRSDLKVRTKNFYWIFGTALLVLISLGTGYFIGLRQSNSKLVALTNNKDMRQTGIGTKSSLSTIPKNKKMASIDDTKSKSQEKVLSLKRESLGHIEMPIDPLNTAQSNQFHLAALNTHSENVPKYHSTSNNEQIGLISTATLTEGTNKNNHSSTEVFLPTNFQNNPTGLESTSLSNLLDEESELIEFDLEKDFKLEKLKIQQIKPISSSNSTILAKGTPFKRHFPTFLSASVGIEQTAFNRLKPDNVYGLGNVYSSNEKGLSSMNVKLGFQAQLGRHLELGIGIGSSNYVTQQMVHNHIVQIDPFVNQLNFESSLGSFHIHEDHLMDDPEDQEEHELNFQDSTAFHLNYQLSNTVKSIQIPITVGFVFQLEKVKLTMKTGLIYNHITQANQQINIRGFNAIENNVSSQLISNSYFHLIQLGAEYPISKHLSIMLAPKYSYALKSISKSTILRPNSIGLECALKFYF